MWFFFFPSFAKCCLCDLLYVSESSKDAASLEVTNTIAAVFHFQLAAALVVVVVWGGGTLARFVYCFATMMLRTKNELKSIRPLVQKWAPYAPLLFLHVLP